MGNRTFFLMLLAVVAIIGGCSRKFPETAWSAAETSRLQELRQQQDFDSRLELARLYFMHNRIDDAEALLVTLVREQPDEPEAIAWEAANRCKIAGRKGPWLLGLDKLYLVWNCLDDLVKVSEKAQDNFTVQLIQMNTDAEVNMFNSLERALVKRDLIKRQIEQEPKAYPPSARSAFLETAAHIEDLRGNVNGAREYWQRLVALNADLDGVSRAKQALAEINERKPKVEPKREQ